MLIALFITTSNLWSQNPISFEYFDKALKKAEAGNTKGAIADYTNAIKNDPLFGEAYLNRALLKLKMAIADGTYLREFTKIQRQDVIILDDFGLQPLDSHNRITLLKIIEDRHNNGSIIVTSQITVQDRYDIIGEKTIADAILDRLIHQSLHGESMRKKRAINKE